jgi:hypothetical protein
MVYDDDLKNRHPLLYSHLINIVLNSDAEFPDWVNSGGVVCRLNV